jgi:hypothetical protein
MKAAAIFINRGGKCSKPTAENVTNPRRKIEKTCGGNFILDPLREAGGVKVYT